MFALIQSYSGWSASSRSWVAECAKRLCRNGDWSLTLIRREANVAADALARKAAREDWNLSHLTAIPSLLGSFICSPSSACFFSEQCSCSFCAPSCLFVIKKTIHHLAKLCYLLLVALRHQLACRI